jgi:nicotinic acid mononucleotide adenylyltransferase
MTVHGQASTKSPPPGGIAVLGGSFNPPHTTHVRLARKALECLPVDEVR